MAKTSRSHRPSTPGDEGVIARITVCGFKSISKPQHINIAPLTILAGANSSGKSSISLRERILKSTTTKTDQKAVEKDLHLIEAALDADRIVVSLDETARRAFALAATQVKELGGLVWANPTREPEECGEWLEGGATVEKSRQLGQ